MNHNPKMAIDQLSSEATVNSNSLIRSVRNSFCRFTFTLLMLGAIAFSNYAQTTSRPDHGFGGGGSFQSTDIDSISYQNGGLNVHIPLASLPPIAGGKLSYTLEATYNSKLWNVYRSENRILQAGCPIRYTTQTVGGADGGAGWQIGAQYEIFFRYIHDDFAFQDPTSVQCDSYDYTYMSMGNWFKPMLRTPDGAEHELRIDGNIQTYDLGAGFSTREYLANSYLWPGGPRDDPQFSSSRRFYTIDGTFLTVVYNPSPNNVRWTIYAKDGTRIEQSTDGQRTIDPNGNSILQGVNSSGQSFVKDEQTGRQVIWYASSYNSQPATTVEYKTVGGTTNSVVVVWGTTTVAGKNIAFTDWDQTAEQTCSNITGLNDSQFNVIRQIILPQTEAGHTRQYTFGYNSDSTVQATTPGGQYYCDQQYQGWTRQASVGWGELSDINTPADSISEDGVHIKYSYSNDGLQDLIDPLDAEAFLNTVATNFVTTKAVTHDGVTDTWVYGASGNILSSQSSGGGVTNPDGSSYGEVYYPVDPAYGTVGWGGGDPMNGRLVKSLQNNRILTERHWTALGGFVGKIGSFNTEAVNPIVDAEYTTILASDGQTRLKMTAKPFSYDYNGELTSTTEYDWFDPSLVTFTNPGSPWLSYLRIPAGVPSQAQKLRVTTNTYHNTASSASDPTAYYHRTVGNGSTVILGKPKETDIGDGVNAPKAKTQFYYDNQSWTTPPTAGNVTKVSSYDDSVNNGQWIDTVTAYTPHGNVQSVTDPNEHITHLTYDSINGFTDLYPTQTVEAYGTSVARTFGASYDFDTGLVTAATDVDNNVATITVYDILGRPTRVRTAANTSLESWTQTEYSDYYKRIIVRSDQDTIGDAKHVAVQFYDQLGRVRLTKTLEDSLSQSATNETDGIKVETRYGFNDPTPATSGDPQNTLGSYVLTSNPFRAANSTTATDEPTMGWTLSYAERSGVHSDVTTYSGASIPTLGSGANSTGTVSTDIDTNRTLVTDQAGKQRIVVKNAVGQLKEVWEITAQDQWTEAISFPGTSIAQGYKTSYNFDVLNDLTTVVQGAQLQNRTFTYSSLSRLTSAFNPESGTTNYVYDAGGNLTQKTDARVVQTDYIYDALNRVTNRNYSTPGGAPPNYQASQNVTYTYDDPSISDSKGRLTKISSSISTTDYLSFDILGRVTRSKQTTDGVEYGGGADPNYWMTYSYNLAGALIEQQYPSGRKVKNIVTNNGDLSIVESKKNPSAGYWHYADTFSYSPLGAATSLQLGNGHWESTSFNSRLQPTHIDLGTLPGTTNLLQLDYSYGTTQNNGNVLSQTITVPTVVKNGNTYNGFVAVQNYTYDALNRLDDASETVSGNQTWRQDFVYDRNGNRTLNESNTTTIPKNCGTSPNFTICNADHQTYNPSASPSSNRLNATDGYAFDAVGNTKSDPDNRTFIYDSENKQVNVKDSSSQAIGDYFYDGDGKRIKKVAYNPPGTETETTVFIYDAVGKEIAEYSDVVENSSDAKVAYLTQDNLGSPRINTDANGSVTARHDYLPFGDETSTSHRNGHIEYSADTIRKQFTGYERDNESDLDFAEARYFNSGHGRFTSVDPLLESAEPGLPQTWNRYVYCLNNPLNLVDPDGQKWEFANEQLQKAFEEAVKAKGKKEWAAYQAIANAKGVIKVGFGDLGKTQFGDTNITNINYSTSWDVKNGKKVNFKSELTVNGTITIGSNKDALDVSNFTDLVSASAHEFTHVLTAMREAGVPGARGLVPNDGLTEKEEDSGKQSFPIEAAAFQAQIQAEKAMIAKGNKPVSPDTALGRANADFGKLKTPTEKYDYLSKTYYTNFKQPRPGPQPPKKK